MYCTRCGAQNPDDANFCARCGHRMPWAQPQATTSSVEPEALLTSGPEAKPPVRATDGEVPELEPGTALLVVVRGPNEGARFLLDRDEIDCGRHPECTIFLDDITVSRLHVTFVRRDGGFDVRDEQSLNGTYVNGERVDEQRLATGDELQIGKFKLMAFVAGRDQ